MVQRSSGNRREYSTQDSSKRKVIRNRAQITSGPPTAREHGRWGLCHDQWGGLKILSQKKGRDYKTCRRQREKQTRRLALNKIHYKGRKEETGMREG